MSSSANEMTAATGTRAASIARGEAMKMKEYDVVILGSGLAGSVAGAILARHGADVVLLDAASHPRFAVGEAMTPSTAEWMHVLSERFDVPEIKSLATIKANTRDIGPVFGLKAQFGFMVHRPGEEPDPREATQTALPSIKAKNGHLFRQATDAFMFQVAVRYGCTPRQNWRAVDVDFDDAGVTVTGHNGEMFRGRYLIDASGFRSPLAEKLDLRETPPRLKHHSRSLFTHYIGIKPFDDVCGHPRNLRPPVPWHKGTMHHLIDRGWFWIIPFDSYPGSKNPLCSVGLNLDERVYPKPAGMTPEEEFQHYLDMYPAIKRQFDGARRVREWVSTDRLQYSSRQTVGDRWCLTSHAAGFIDALWSRGLINTFQVLNALMPRLLDALKDGDFSRSRFAYVEELERGLLQHNDDHINCCYISFSNFRLWNAVFRMSEVFKIPALLRMHEARIRYAYDRDDRHFRALENTRKPGQPPSDKTNSLFDATVETCEKYEAGALSGDEAADVILKLLGECDIVAPSLGWKNPEKRFVYPRAVTLARFMYWALFQGPPEMRRMSRGYLKAVMTAGVRARKVLY